MVSIAAFQAVDPGSIPGRRNSFLLAHFRREEVLIRANWKLLKLQAMKIIKCNKMGQKWLIFIYFPF